MQQKPFKLASIGGTFGAFHQGHKDYIDLAFSLAQRVQIGINDSDHAQTSKKYAVPTLEQRLKNLGSYLDEKHFSNRATVIVYKAVDDFHQALLNPEVDCVIVLDEYYQTAREMNQRRIAQGAAEYHVHVKPRTLLNGEELSSTKIHSIDT